MNEKEIFVQSLEHWADWFKSNDDDFADEIVHLLEDKAHDVREDMKLRCSDDG